MGFYSLSTIIDDAKRHGLLIQGVDVCASEWECILEPLHQDKGFAVRIGLKFVKGMSKVHCEKIINSRNGKLFTSQNDFIKRVHLNNIVLKNLAQAGAFDSLSYCRRKSLWMTCDAKHIRESTLPMSESSEHINFIPLSKCEQITWDYSSTNHSTHDHPLAPFRSKMRKMKLPTALEVYRRPHNAWIQYMGIPICRQSPGTASGVVFMTLEDETGFVNLIVWPNIFEKYKKIAKTAAVLGASGRIQSEDGVVHIVARRLWKPQWHVDPIEVQSRDFI